jgi:hypothetical protein
MADQAIVHLNALDPWLFILAHPGHELRAHHVMERVRPLVAVLTDGSGATGIPRVDESRALLTRAGARPAATFGTLTDRDAYAALMASDAEPFLREVEGLTSALHAESARAVVVDAAEGYNPVHDVCHWLGRAAVTRARRSGSPIDLFELDLISHPDGTGDGLRIHLDDAAFARKMDATTRYSALRAEAESAFDRYGHEAFRVEFLRRVNGAPPPPASWVPYYEEVGEARVRAGRYPSVLRYGTHVKPVIEHLLGC